ncbi:UDP-galactose 4-epimerase [Salinihabitans flavidus]|uniref:UDP-glucose 4-epimerase n=1 Tax=Salinihabitans flavidus TaxID=569882 RepID=A0A1H8T2Z5_9RHOB|nr:UDP-glucose 4-epimerase GalE [Salinihabitans flavidus]SEO85307.1 UDP-galactose 4-epimerase [Salinihabitans flavidus]
MRVLVTGGAGYIGSHVARRLLDSGIGVCVIDDLSTGNLHRLRALERTARAAYRFDLCDVRDPGALNRVLGATRPDTVIHLAGLKDVAHSFADPQAYDEINVGGTTNLLAAAAKYGVARFVFSSSAAIYGRSARGPSRETDAPDPSSPYGLSKLRAEALVRDWALDAPATRRAVILRYFNPCGSLPDLVCDQSNGNGQTRALAEVVAEVATGRRPYLEIFGRNHPTPDGTCRRDFVHIADIVEAHLASVRREAHRLDPIEILNIGSGKDHSILEFLAVFRRVTGIAVPYRFLAPRPGDAAISCANIALAAARLDWRPKFGLSEACRALSVDHTIKMPVRVAPNPVLEPTRIAMAP